MRAKHSDYQLLVLTVILRPNAFPQYIIGMFAVRSLSRRSTNDTALKQIAKVFIAGIDTDMCVLKIAMDLFDIGVEPIALTDCCASTAGLQAHLAGLAVLSRNIGANRLRESSLGNGTLAAPA